MPDKYDKFDKWHFPRYDRTPRRVKVLMQLSCGDLVIESWCGETKVVNQRELHDTFVAARASCADWAECFGSGNGRRKVSEGLREIKEGKQEVAAIRATKKPTKPIGRKRDC